MANKGKETTKTIIIATMIFILGGAIGALISKSLTPSCVSCTIKAEEYQAKIDEINISLGQAIEIIESNGDIIDSLQVIADKNNTLIAIKQKEIEGLETKRKELKALNDELFQQTIYRVNTSPSYLDSLRRKHFGG